jgi:hypothetical protein
VACVGYLTISYREERETWAAELGGSGSDTGTLKETLTVTFYQEKLHWFSAPRGAWKTGVKFSSI